MTAQELDRLAVVQAEIRAIFADARTHIMGWEPAPFVPAPSTRQAAVPGPGAGTSSAPGGRVTPGAVAPAAVPGVPTEQVP